MQNDDQVREEFQDIVEEYERAVSRARREAVRLLAHFSKKIELREIGEMQKRITKKMAI